MQFVWTTGPGDLAWESVLHTVQTKVRSVAGSARACATGSWLLCAPMLSAPMVDSPISYELNRTSLEVLLWTSGHASVVLLYCYVDVHLWTLQTLQTGFYWPMLLVASWNRFVLRLCVAACFGPPASLCHTWYCVASLCTQLARTLAAEHAACTHAISWACILHEAVVGCVVVSCELALAVPRRCELFRVNCFHWSLHANIACEEIPSRSDMYKSMLVSEMK